VILLDTHIWVWWANRDARIPPTIAQQLTARESSGLGVSAISCWEVAKLVEYKRLSLKLPVKDWIAQALAYPGIQLLPLSPEIAVESTQLPPPFHKDPADQIIVATARIHQVELATCDQLIQAYPHVKLLT
jgi:PIN domain nuclease of toxin-antitoxin system